MENLSESLIELCALRNLGLLTTEIAIEFGVNALIEGADSPALRRLAGAYPRDHLADVIPWLDKALTELGIEKSQFEMGAYYRPYSRLLTKQVLKGILSPRQGLKRLAELLYLTPENDRLLYFFSELEDALDFWPQDTFEAEALYPELSQMDPETCIRAECELFLAFSAFRELREDLFFLAHCPSCKMLVKQQYIPVKQPWNETLMRLIARGHQPHISVCSQCQRPEPLSLSSVAGRRKYLEQMNTMNT